MARPAALADHFMSTPNTARAPDAPRRKLQIWMDEAEIDEIDAWQFEHRLPTRAAAIRELLKRGMAADSTG